MNIPHSEDLWEGYRRLTFKLNEKKCYLVLPHKAVGNNWLLKTEYFGAFPNFELAMLERGWHLAYMETTTRWYKEIDSENKAALCRFLHEEFGLAEKCVCVGMSCGGMQAVYLAARHPACVKALYLDAPVLNLLSCPCNVGRTEPATMYPEFCEKTGMTLHDLINYRNHPMDNVQPILDNRIPVMLICGDADVIVPYDENGMVLSNILREAGHPFREILKPGCGQHPHGLEDPTPIIEFVEKYC